MLPALALPFRFTQCWGIRIVARLGVNIDHVATIRQARKTVEPDPVWAAALAELGGADLITVHLREDRRHIQDRDLLVLKQTSQVKLNLELSLEPSIVDLAVQTCPQQATLVPERREEVTTEGGLDVRAHLDRVRACVKSLHGAGIVVSMFIDADLEQIALSKSVGATAIELHTGQYAEAIDDLSRERELAKLSAGVERARELGLAVHAGHGLTYRNVQPVAALPGIDELNIGHSIVARAVMVGFSQAVREMKALIDQASRK